MKEARTKLVAALKHNGHPHHHIKAAFSKPITQKQVEDLSGPKPEIEFLGLGLTPEMAVEESRRRRLQREAISNLKQLGHDNGAIACILSSMGHEIGTDET